MERYIFSVLFVSLLFTACSKEEDCDDGDNTFNPTEVDLNAKLPPYLPKMVIPPDNPTTEEGIEFGRVLFYEPLLSGDGTQSCGTCHVQQFNFTDNGNRFSEGIDGLKGNRNAMQISNAGIGKKFFWDGRALSLEDQAFQPVTNPIEMHETWKNAVSKLNQVVAYQDMNYRAFGTRTIDSVSVSKAISQFERSLISNNSKYDRFKVDSLMFPLSASEMRGKILFFRDRIVIGSTVRSGADCFHCHVDLLDMADGKFHNNGLDAQPQDSGLAKVTKNGYDIGRFKTPSLRNVEYSGPYMHDGRFPNLDSVINFYSEGLQYSDNIDPLMKNIGIGGVRLTASEKADLKAFLLTLSDIDFISNPAYSDPNVSARR